MIVNIIMLYLLFFIGFRGFPRTCLHSILGLLNTSLRSRTNMTTPVVNHSLVELSYRLIYALAGNIRTSEPTLRFLRSSGDFLQRHLAALPFRSNNPGKVFCELTVILEDCFLFFNFFSQFLMN